MCSNMPNTSKYAESFQVLLARVTGGRRLTLYETLAVRGDSKRHLQRDLKTWRVDESGESRVVAQLHKKNDANVQRRRFSSELRTCGQSYPEVHVSMGSLGRGQLFGVWK